MPLRPGDWLVSGVSVSVWLLGSTTPWRFAEYREVLNQMNTAPTLFFSYILTPTQIPREA